MMALSNELVGKVTNAANWLFEHIAIFREQRGTGTLEALDSGLFDPVMHLQFERGLNVSYQSITEELAARAIRHERRAGEIRFTLRIIEKMTPRQAEALVWRYGNRKKGGDPLGAALVAKRMGISRQSADELIAKAETKLSEAFAQPENKSRAA